MPDPKYADLIADKFPCSVCGWLDREIDQLGAGLIKETVRILKRNCPLCALGRPDLWVAGREWLRERGWKIDAIAENVEFKNVFVSFIDNDGFGDNSCSGSGPTDIDALLDVIEQVEGERDESEM